MPIFRSSHYTRHHRTVFGEKRQKSTSVNWSLTTLVRNEEHVFNHEGESSHWNNVLSLQLIRSSLQAVFLSKRPALAKYKIPCHCPCQIRPWMSRWIYPQTLRSFGKSRNHLVTTLFPPPLPSPPPPVYSLWSTSLQRGRLVLCLLLSPNKHLLHAALGQSPLFTSNIHTVTL